MVDLKQWWLPLMKETSIRWTLRSRSSRRKASRMSSVSASVGPASECLRRNRSRRCRMGAALERASNRQRRDCSIKDHVISSDAGSMSRMRRLGALDGDRPTDCEGTFGHANTVLELACTANVRLYSRWHHSS